MTESMFVNSVHDNDKNNHSSNSKDKDDSLMS